MLTDFCECAYAVAETDVLGHLSGNPTYQELALRSQAITLMIVSNNNTHPVRAM
jgi:hypothetical protein